MRLSCVVPATDDPPALGRCIEAIQSANPPPDELIVVSEPAIAGPAAARNQGADRATGDLLVFVDADVLVHGDAFERIRAAFERSPGLTAVFGSYDDAPEAAGAVSGFRNLLHHHVHQSGEGSATTFWAGLGAVRRKAFEAAGGFDSERYRTASIEDIELGSRLAADGGLFWLDPAIQGTHLKHWTLPQMIRTDYQRRGLQWSRLLLSSRRLPRTLNLGWRHRLSAIASVIGALALVLRRPRAALLAILLMVGLNADFYRLLLRRRGASQVVVGVPLHLIHHLTAAASGSAAALEALAGERPGGSRGPGPLDKEA
jgi:GT2 family glycosyltransferase